MTPEEKVFWKNYIPRFGPQTEEEEEQIRQRIKISPKFCNHLKGNIPKRSPLPRKDYNFSLHTFINGKQRIRCNSCGQKWFKTSHDWALALERFAQSSNTPSSSEQCGYQVLQGKASLGWFNDLKEIYKKYPKAKLKN